MSIATSTSHASAVPTPPRIVALQKRQEEPPCLAPVAPNMEPGPQSRRAFDRQQADQSLRQLQAMCILAPELERITRKTRRHWQNGTYQHDVLVDVLHRFVVEPAAIDLTAARPEQHLPWFQTYPGGVLGIRRAVYPISQTPRGSQSRLSREAFGCWPAKRGTEPTGPSYS